MCTGGHLDAGAGATKLIRLPDARCHGCAGRVSSTEVGAPHISARMHPTTAARRAASPRVASASRS
eukprot:12527180-Alexandrium_andersonii.AAC.2